MRLGTQHEVQCFCFRFNTSEKASNKKKKILLLAHCDCPKVPQAIIGRNNLEIVQRASEISQSHRSLLPPHKLWQSLPEFPNLRKNKTADEHAADYHCVRTRCIHVVALLDETELRSGFTRLDRCPMMSEAQHNPICLSCHPCRL